MYRDLKTSSLIISDTQPIVFLHLPKTAGTTILSVLQRIFKPDEISPWYFMNDIPARVDGYKLYVGHFYYSAIHKLISQDAVYFTFLREPIARTISNYHHLSRAAAEDPTFMPDFPATLEEFIFDPVLGRTICNIQSVILGTELDFSGLHDLDEVWRESVDAKRRIPAESAYKVLDNIPFVGITERYTESMALLSYTFGWPPMFDIQWLNKGDYKSRRDDIPPHVIQKIAELNEEDLKLYAYGTRVFENRYNEMLRDMSRRYYVTHEMMTKPRRSDIRLEFDHAPSDGFYPPEYWGDTGRMFVWTGPERRASFDLALSAGEDLIVRFWVIDAAYPRMLDNLTLLVNDNPVPLTRKTADDGTYEFSGVIPKAAIPEDLYFSTITFDIGEPTLPVADEGETETRGLGIALIGFQVRAIYKTKRTAAVAAAPMAALSANLKIHQTVSVLSVGEQIEVEVDVENTGDIWHALGHESDAYAIHLGCFWTDSNGDYVAASESRAQIPYDFHTADRETITIMLIAPPSAGRYTAHLNMLQEQVSWFTSPSVDLDITVTD